ncbi:MFS transporter [Sinorhizobium meliloti]|uniref:MFS transporter n=1 Tax=Rhizobium meliloti TaxID=382 RepID=UPI000FD5E71D|nr:MFS transporter [Sinorhizobium meliloti]RVH21059.1 MFS transporter [Sinorhizobium meliloti]RVI16275.1 MFS transporter [Sinorhizobium meliloti]RVN87932.1 MFS transporter [Sinorhizobium meliloti]RVO00648.1 MFS transporter [Sinorhizobium meliloti]
MDNSTALIALGTRQYRRLAIAMVMAGFSTFSLLYSAQPLLPFFTAHFAVSPEEASLAVSLATGPMAIGIIFAGWIANRVGRRPIMVFSLASAAIYGSLAGLAPSWESLLLLRGLAGIALAGVPAVAMVYVSEEVVPSAISPAMGLFIAGSALGGMIGRLGAAFAAEWFGWRWGLGATGLFSAAAALVFWAYAPSSRGFVTRTQSLRSALASYRKVLRDRALLLLYAEGFLMMGAFVTVYNYVPFRLVAEPYALGGSAIGAIFLLYILGSISSTWFGRAAGKLGVRRTFWVPLTVLLAGIVATGSTPLWIIVGGIALVTAGFFGAHTIASSWVSRRAFGERGYASAVYLFSYYAGSSLLGSAGGFVWSHSGWPGIIVFCGLLCLLALAIAFVVARVPPLADPRQPKMGQQMPG